MTGALVAATPGAGSPQRARLVAILTLVTGAALLATTIRADQSTVQFMVAGCGLAAVWCTGFAVAQGRRPLARTRPALDAGRGLALGLIMFGAFVVGAWAARRLELLDEPIDDILRRADAHARIWVIPLAAINAVAEELFFRGTMMDAFTRRYAVVATTVVYAVITTAGGNAALALAALVMGAVLAAERRWTRSLVAPIVTHLSWAVLMITAFPRA